jgi:HSP20 family protein
MLLRFDPFREMDRLAQTASQAASAPQSFPLDAFRRGDRFVVEFDLPGIDASTLDITVERNVMTVTGERRSAMQQGDEVLIAERPQGVFTRQLMLGDALDGERISARYHDGVLTLEIPVAEQAKPRKIPVSADGGPETIDAGGGDGAQQPQPAGATA